MPGFLTAVLAAVSVNAALALLVFFSKDFLSEWLKRKAGQGFDEKIEKLRTELRNSETAFTHELNRRQRDLETLRDGALSVASARRLALENRRLIAAERLWANLVELQSFKFVSAMMSIVKYEPTAKAASKDAGVRKMFEIYAKSAPVEKLSVISASNERPFLPATVWAYFWAYAAIVGYAVAQAKALELGAAETIKLDHDHVGKLIVAALPHYSDYVKDVGPGGFHYVLDSLEEQLLTELRNMLEGKEADAEQLAKAKAIMLEADKVQASSLAPRDEE
jgi:hypothetical protein